VDLGKKERLFIPNAGKIEAPRTWWYSFLSAITV